MRGAGHYLNGITSNYGYDAIYELLQVTQGGSTTESYSYDAVRNRLSSSGVPSYSYNASNELTSNSSGSYTYDANGNTLSDASGRSYAWDFENRLVSAVVPGTGAVTFKYDPFGRRIHKSSSSGTSIYTFDGNELVDETNSSGGAVASYSQDLNIDAPLAMLRSSTTSYYQPDGLGSITSLTNTAGAVAGNYTYDSFGKLVAATGTLNNSFRYTGRDDNSGDPGNNCDADCQLQQAEQSAQYALNDPTCGQAADGGTGACVRYNYRQPSHAWA
jgi:YD repeat-containing protein